MGDVSEGIFPVITVDRRTANPLHRQIYDGFRAAIVRGDLRPGQRVPSSRELAHELSLSRIPVLNELHRDLQQSFIPLVAARIYFSIAHTNRHTFQFFELDADALHLIKDVLDSWHLVG